VTIYFVSNPEQALNPSVFISRVPYIANLWCDGAIAGALMYYFRAYRTGMPRTEPVMQQLIWLSMSTGLLLCLGSGIAWVVFETDPGSASCDGPMFVLGKLYLNSMLANLNSRKHFRSVIERSIDFSCNIEISHLATE